MKRFLTGVALAAAAMAATPAMAITTTRGAANVMPSISSVTSMYQSGYSLYTFDDLTTPFTGGEVKTTNSPPLYAEPAGDTTPYFAVGPSTSTPATLAITGVNLISFYWGSIDSFNNITFNFNGMASQTFDGTMFDGTDAVRNGREVSFHLTDAEAAALTSITMSSNTNAFEIDNLVIGNAVPEPATWGIMTLGLGLVGAVMRRRRQLSEAGALTLA